MKLSRSSVDLSALMCMWCCQAALGLDDCSKRQKNAPFQWWCDPHTVFRSKVGCTCLVSCASLPEINGKFSISTIGLDIWVSVASQIQCVGNLVLWILHITLICMHSRCDDHKSLITGLPPPRPLQKRIRLQASKFISTCCTIWATFRSRAPDRLPVSRKKSLLLWVRGLRCSCITRGWTSWWFSCAPNCYCGRPCGNTHQ